MPVPRSAKSLLVVPSALLGGAFLVAVVVACSSSTPSDTAPVVEAGQDVIVPKDSSTPATNPERCDVVAQDCVVSPSTRCSVVKETPYAAHCVSKTGTKSAGESCTADLADGDDCAKGAFCSVVGNGLAKPKCAKLCHANADCGGSETCVNIQSSTDFTRYTGP